MIQSLHLCTGTVVFINDIIIVDEQTLILFQRIYLIT